MRPTSAEELKAYCLRKLGGGAVRVNITDDQVNDRLDDALQEFGMHHYDGFTQTIFGVNVIPGVGEYTLDSDILTVSRMMRGVQSMYEGSLFTDSAWSYHNTRMAYGAIFSLVNFHTWLDKLSTLNAYSNHAKSSFDFNYVDHKLTIYPTPQNNEIVGFIGYKVNNPPPATGNPPTLPPSDLYDNKWLKDYFTALLRIQWGDNLVKYVGVPLPGGSTLNGQGILDRGLAEKKELEEQLELKYSEPALFFVG